MPFLSLVHAAPTLSREPVELLTHRAWHGCTIRTKVGIDGFFVVGNAPKIRSYGLFGSDPGAVENSLRCAEDIFVDLDRKRHIISLVSLKPSVKQTAESFIFDRG